VQEARPEVCLFDRDPVATNVTSITERPRTEVTLRRSILTPSHVQPADQSQSEWLCSRLLLDEHGQQQHEACMWNNSTQN
jgi:hypothetical protein